MTYRSIVGAALASAPLILSGPASADFIGLTTIKKDTTGFEPIVALVVNLYAVFSDDDGDGIGDGALIAVAGFGPFPANVSVRDGVFYHNPLNTNNAGRTAPPQAFVDIFPSIAVDTFLTIGLKTVPTGVNDTTRLTAAFPVPGQPPRPMFGSWTDTRLTMLNAAWFAFDPDSDQTRPGNFDNPPGQVLIGQFSVAAGAGVDAGVFGTLFIEGENADGSVFGEYLSFDTPAPGALGVFGAAGLLGCRRRRRNARTCTCVCVQVARPHFTLASRVGP